MGPPPTVCWPKSAPTHTHFLLIFDSSRLRINQSINQSKRWLDRLDASRVRHVLLTILSFWYPDIWVSEFLCTWVPMYAGIPIPRYPGAWVPSKGPVKSRATPMLSWQPATDTTRRGGKGFKTGYNMHIRNNLLIGEGL